MPLVDGLLRNSFPVVSVVRALKRFAQRRRYFTTLRRFDLTHYATTDWARSEARSLDALRRAEMGAPWVTKPIYPVGGAAGPLLCYLIIRSLQELPIRKVLELGAGQSTVLLDSWAQSAGGYVTTFEHDQWWADHVRSLTSRKTSEVLWLSLGPGSHSPWYHGVPAGIVANGGFDMVLVDGPLGASRFSRFGIVDHIPEWIGSNWLIIWDDLDRAADLESFGSLVSKLTTAQVPHDHVLFDGDRTVGVIFSPAFRAVKHFW